jgi:cystathionine beta-lyase/cystathionine gamma-synthase
MAPYLASHCVKPPLYLTSTFSFSSADHGKAYAEAINGLRTQRPDEDFSNTYIYSRDTNPNLEIFERRLVSWEDAEAGAAFMSGMAASDFTVLGFLNLGDILVYSEPICGGTDYLIKRTLVRFGIRPVSVRLHDGKAGLDNPTIGLIADIEQALMHLLDTPRSVWMTIHFGAVYVLWFNCITACRSWCKRRRLWRPGSACRRRRNIPGASWCTCI